MALTLTTLAERVRDVIRSYATHGYSGGQPLRLYDLENLHDQVFSVVAPYDPLYERADLVIMARIVNNQVIIDLDKTSVSLYGELKRAGIAENQIILVWKADRPPPHNPLSSIQIYPHNHTPIALSVVTIKEGNRA